MTYDAEMAERFDRVVDDLLDALADDPMLVKLGPRVPVDGFDGGSVNGRRALGKIIRAALKARLVYASERQADFIARSGSASHDDTPTDLMPEDQWELLRELYDYVVKLEGGYAAQAAVRGYMPKPDEIHPGVEDLGRRVRAALGIAEPDSKGGERPTANS